MGRSTGQAGRPSCRTSSGATVAGRFCPTGSAVVSDAGNLPARWVIHAVGPVWHGGAAGEPELLAGAYRTSLRLAAELGATSVAFPSISTGVYGYPVDLAAQIAIDTVSDMLAMEPGSVERVTFVLFSRDALEVFEEVLSR